MIKSYKLPKTSRTNNSHSFTVPESQDWVQHGHIHS